MVSKLRLTYPGCSFLIGRTKETTMETIGGGGYDGNREGREVIKRSVLVCKWGWGGGGGGSKRYARVPRQADGLVGASRSASLPSIFRETVA